MHLHSQIHMFLIIYWNLFFSYSIINKNSNNEQLEYKFTAFVFVLNCVCYDDFHLLLLQTPIAVLSSFFKSNVHKLILIFDVKDYKALPSPSNLIETEKAAQPLKSFKGQSKALYAPALNYP